MNKTLKLLRIDASSRDTNSVSKELGDTFLTHLERHGAVRVDTCNLRENLPLVDAAWVGANNTAAAERSQHQRDALARSDELVNQLMAADLLLITTPIYNFGIPAALKAWIDQVARAGLTFNYTSDGPVGLLENKRAIVVVTSGGTAVGSDIDFVTPYLKHVLGFIGIHDVDFVAAERLGRGDDQIVIDAKEALARLAGNI